MGAQEDIWTTIPIKQSTKGRLMALKRPKPNRKKNEHYMETLATVLVRVIDFYEKNSPSATR